MNALIQSVSPDAAMNASALAEIAAIRARLTILEAQLIDGVKASGPGVFHRLWIDRVANLVATEWSLSLGELKGSCRDQRLTRPRFVWVWLVKQIGNFSNTRCALECAYLDHTSVIHACRRVEGWRAKYDDFRAVTDQLLEIGRAIRAPQPASADAEAAE